MPGIKSFILCVLVAYAVSPRHYRSSIEPAMLELEQLLGVDAAPDNIARAFAILDDTPLLRRRLFEEQSGRSYYLLSRLQSAGWTPNDMRYNSKMSYRRAALDAGYRPKHAGERSLDPQKQN